MPVILKVVLFNQFPGSFDYLAPPELILPTLPGFRVKISFGRQTLIAWCHAYANTSSFSLAKLKPVLAILDQAALFDSTFIDFMLFASNYYQQDLGSVYASCLPSLLRQGKPIALSEKTRTRHRNQNRSKEWTPPKLPILNQMQEQAVNAITASKNSHQTFLLNGITGSGKTEVYMRAISGLIGPGDQVLILVPEIGLTPQTIARFQQRFNLDMAILHSSLTPLKRLSAWISSRDGSAQVIIGTRSACFSPCQNLKLIIVDEEHDTSYKQQSGFRYSARDLAIVRAKLAKCPIVLGTATPCLETLYQTQINKYQELVLAQRAGEAKTAKFHIIDTRHRQLQAGLSNALVAHIKRHLDSGNQVLVFMNKRGFSPVFMCQQCLWMAKCPHCDAKLVFYDKKNILRCHHCAYKRAIYSQCPSCQADKLIKVGFGTEKIEQYLLSLFPEFPVVRIDKDSTQNKSNMFAMIDDILSGKPQILLGTQMIAKGHHFPNINMVAIVDCDSAFYGIDFRNLEHLSQLITQVAGRAGRTDKQGEVFLQTQYPDHPLFNTIFNQGYSTFANHLLLERKLANLPPFSFQALIRMHNKKPGQAEIILAEVKEVLLLSAPKFVKILGPAEAPMAKRIGYYHAQLLLQAPKRSLLNHSLRIACAELNLMKNIACMWSIDVDPQDMM